VRKAVAVVCGSFVLAAAARADRSAERQTVIVECSGGCETVLPALRRMGGEVTSNDPSSDTLVVRIATERLPEIPMLRGVKAAFKDRPGAIATSALKSAVGRRATVAERRRESTAGVSSAPRVVAPGKGVALKSNGSRQVRTARSPSEAEPVLQTADVPPGTAAGVIAQNDLVPVLVEVPPGTRELSFVLLWENHSGEDVDLIVLKPDGNAEVAGVTLRSPEHAVVKDPQPGVWTAFVNGFAMNGHTDQWQLAVAADGTSLPSR
jgi:hypothetical protein